MGASWVLGRDVPVDEPYPHLCGATVAGRMSGRQVTLTRRDCAACLARTPRTGTTVRLPALDVQALAAGEGQRDAA